VAQYGYNFSYLGFLIEIVKEIFPFGASAPDNKHYYTVVLHITSEATQPYSVDSLHLAPVSFAVGQQIYAGDSDGTQKGPMKWSGTNFEPATSAEQNEIRDAVNNGGIPATPKYDNIRGWSRRMVVGDTSNGAVEKMLRLRSNSQANR
jgi:hypothetical protein